MTTDIKLSAVNRAVALLNAAGAKYKVIYNEHEFGELKLAPPESPKRNKDYPRGERTAYIRAYVGDMKVGEVTVIPFGPYPKDDIAPLVPPACHDLWGNGGYQTEVVDKGVTVLRVL